MKLLQNIETITNYWNYYKLLKLLQTIETITNYWNYYELLKLLQTIETITNYWNYYKLLKNHYKTFHNLAERKLLQTITNYWNYYKLLKLLQTIEKPLQNFPRLTWKKPRHWSWATPWRRTCRGFWPPRPRPRGNSRATSPTLEPSPWAWSCRRSSTWRRGAGRRTGTGAFLVTARPGGQGGGGIRIYAFKR